MATHEHKSATTLIAIGIFKLVKALLLVITGFGVLSLLHKDLETTVDHWVQLIRVDPDNALVHSALSKVLSVTPRQLEQLSAGTFIYAALLLTEGIGLLRRKHWAEYFTVITTAGLIPLELYELAKHFTWMKIVVLAVNLAIVVYLVLRLVSDSRAKRQDAGTDKTALRQPASYRSSRLD